MLVYSPYGDLLYILLFVPVICLTGLIAVVIAGLFKRRRQFQSLSLTLFAFLVVSGFLHMNSDGLRASLCWLLWSHRLKAEVLAQPAPAKGELKHMEWEATGFAGVANEVVYLLYDPTDSLSTAASSHLPGKFSGIPCEVPRVRRLERKW